MSRKKKKKSKKLAIESDENKSLHGWSCPATDVDDDDSEEADDSEDISEIAEIAEIAEVTEIAEIAGVAEIADVADVAEQQTENVWEQSTFEDCEKPAAVTEEVSPPPPETASETSPETASETSPETASAENTDLAQAIKERVSDRLEKSKDGLLKLFATPRKSKKELEEDEAKFGGLDDEPLPEDTKPHPLSVLYPAMRYAYETYGWGYTECYYIGIQVLRNASDLRRRAFGLWVWARYNIPAAVRKYRGRIAAALDAVTDACLHPFRDISAKTRHMQSEMIRIGDRKKEVGTVDRAAVTKPFFHYLYSLGKPLNSIASFILPILGCAVLAAVILYFQQLSYALEVEYSGVQLGYVSREGDFYEARNKVYDRLINEEYAPPDNARPTFRLVITDKENLISTEALANKIMTVSKNEVAMADGIYIDGAFLGAVEDGSEFLFYIDSILENYRTGTANERVQFVKKVGLQRGMYPVSSIRPVHEIKNALESNESLPQTHKVAKGETLEAIAADNNTEVKDIIKLNASLQARADESYSDTPQIFEGEEILVNRVELSLGIQVTRREVYTEEIDYGIDYTDNNKQMENYLVTLSNGVKGKREIISDITYIDGEKVDESVIERNVIKEPVNARKVRGTLKPADFLPAGNGDSTASFIWPVAGGYVSAGLYGYRGHTGMDIAAPYGTGIYAGRSGTVTYASNRNVWPYGKRVNISHGDGVTSLYAHCSEVVVQSGQYVKQGQLIAKIGRTGNASGNHCHFEIRINGRVMNPADFIGKG